jgi:hypothetical protein
MKGAIIFIIAILILSYGFSLLASNSGPAVPQPSSFVAASWMSIVPQDVLVLRYWDIPDLASTATLFPTPVILSIANPGLNLTVGAISYEVFMELNSTAGVNAYALNSTTLTAFGTSLENSNLTTSTFGNVTFYKLQQNLSSGATETWVCVTKGMFIIAQGNGTAVPALESVVAATPETFFSTDQLKVAYLLSNNSGPNIYFSYLNPGTNSFNITWAMNGITNGTSLDVRTIFNFPSASVMNNQYNNVKKNLLSEDTSLNTVNSYAVIYGDINYPYSEITSLLSGGVF